RTLVHRFAFREMTLVRCDTGQGDQSIRVSRGELQSLLEERARFGQATEEKKCRAQTELRLQVCRLQLQCLPQRRLRLDDAPSDTQQSPEVTQRLRVLGPYLDGTPILRLRVAKPSQTPQRVAKIVAGDGVARIPLQQLLVTLRGLRIRS